MMRYQRVTSPDVLPLSNGRKLGLRACKEEDAGEAGRTASYSPFETKSLRLRPGFGSGNPSPSPSPTRDHHSPHISFPPANSDTRPLASSASPPASASAGPAKAQSPHQTDGVGHGGGGDVLLRWGQKKRSRGPRTEARVLAAAGDESPAHSRSAVRVQRRSSAAAAAAVMPPPRGLNAKGAYLRPCTSSRAAATVSPMSSRGAEERSGGLIRPEKRSPQHQPEKAQKASANGCFYSMNPDSKQPSDLDNNGAVTTTVTEKPNLDHFEWPRIYISLSRKEKEDDFLAMKGTKLPQRPKKRAKNIDRALQYCFPGMWLSDLTRGRYEVREKKRVKKKRRGLKGMESSDSE